MVRPCAVVCIRTDRRRRLGKQTTTQPCICMSLRKYRAHSRQQRHRVAVVSLTRQKPEQLSESRQSKSFTYELDPSHHRLSRRLEEPTYIICTRQLVQEPRPRVAGVLEQWQLLWALVRVLRATMQPCGRMEMGYGYI